MKTNIPFDDLVRNIETLCNMLERSVDLAVINLPDFILEIALRAKWIPSHRMPKDFVESPDGPLVVVGDTFCIERSERDQFWEIVIVTLEIGPCDWEIFELRRKVMELRQRGLWDGPDDPDDEYLEKSKVRIYEFANSSYGPSHLVEMPEPFVSTRPKAHDIIKAWRNRTGLTIKRLAELAKISPATIYRIQAEEFEYTTGRDSLQRLAGVLGCEWHELLPPPKSKP